MILITGASGKTGKAILQALTKKGENVRALVRRPEQEETLMQLGAKEVVVGNMSDPMVLAEAAQGMHTFCHICPNVNPDEAGIGRSAIAAAQKAGVAHFVYYSVLHPQVEAMPHHWQKMQVEGALFESGLNFTVLQPAAYMQNILAQLTSIQQGVYAMPYAVESKFSLVDLEDVAEAAALVMTQPGHIGAIYELAGPEVMTQTEIARVLSQVLGRTVAARQIARQDWERDALAGGMDAYALETLIKMFIYYEQYGFWGNPKVLTWLLGRPPVTLAQFLQRAVLSVRKE